MRIPVHPTLPLFAIGLLLIAAAPGCRSDGPTSATAARASAQRSTEESAASRATIRIDGMACPFCTYNIERQLQAVEGVERVDVSLEKGEAYVTLSKQNPPTEQRLRAAVKSAGLPPFQSTL